MLNLSCCCVPGLFIVLFLHSEFCRRRTNGCFLSIRPRKRLYVEDNKTSWSLHMEPVSGWDISKSLTLDACLKRFLNSLNGENVTKV